MFVKKSKFACKIIRDTFDILTLKKIIHHLFYTAHVRMNDNYMHYLKFQMYDIY